MIGDSGIGKSSIIERIVNNTFHSMFITTIGIDFKVYYKTVGKKHVKLQLWDSAGQERFRSITKNYFNRAHGIILVYDVTYQKSFDNLQYWLKSINNNIEPGSVKLFLFGTKIDRISDRVISYETGKKYAEKNGLEFYEVSSKIPREGKMNYAFAEIMEKLIENNDVNKSFDDSNVMNFKDIYDKKKKMLLKIEYFVFVAKEILY